MSTFLSSMSLQTLACLSFFAVAAACSLQLPDEDKAFAHTGASARGGSGGVDSAGGVNSGGVNSGGDSAIGGDEPRGAGARAGAFDPDAGLAAHFSFDEASGDVAANEKDSTKNGSYEGACTHAPGHIGTAAVGIRNLAESTIDYVALPAGILAPFSATTIALWTRDLSTARSGARLFHFSRGAAEELYFAPDEKNAASSSQGAHLGGTHDGASFADLWTTTALIDKSWHHVAVSWNAASIDLYVDGRAAGSQAKPGIVPSGLGATSPNWLGRTLNDASIQLYAEIDDLRIYDRALTATEIAALYLL
jgi:hypothetical protein